jgi:hypothetical protein
MISTLHMKPGPRMGWILHALLEEVLDDPDKNTEEFLVKRTAELDNLSDTELRDKGEAGRQARDNAEEAEIKEVKKKHKVQ